LICNPDPGFCPTALDNRLDLNQVTMDNKNKEIDFNLLSLYNTKLNIDALYLVQFSGFRLPRRSGCAAGASDSLPLGSRSICGPKFASDSGLPS
jgi:hypothetical protein